MNFELISKHVTPSFIIDCGARLGDWSKEAEKVWPGADFLLIEANEECRAFLEETHFAYRIAVLSDAIKEVDFFTMRDCPTATGASYYREKTPFFEGDKATVTKRETTTLDMAMQEHIALGFHALPTILLKLDCQGAELDILHGAKELLKTHYVRAIVCEVSHREYNEGAPSTNARVGAFMSENGYYVAEKLGDVVHPIEREKIIQSDLLFLKL